MPFSSFETEILDFCDLLVHLNTNTELKYTIYFNHFKLSKIEKAKKMFRGFFYYVY